MATTNEPRPMRGVAMAAPAVETSEGVGVPGCELMAAVVEGAGVVADAVEDSTPLLAGGGVAEDSAGPDEAGGGTSPDEAGGAGGTSADEAGGVGGTSTDEAGGVGAV